MKKIKLINKKPEKKSVIYRRKDYYTGKNLNGIKNKEINIERKKVENKIKKHKLIATFCVTSFITILMVLALLNNFINKPRIEVKYYNKKQHIDEKYLKSYNKDLERYFSKRPLEKFSFFLNSSSLKNYMYHENNEIKDIDYSRNKNIFGKDIFYLKLREPVASLNMNEKNIFVDRNGFSYYKNPLKIKSKINIIDHSGTKTISNKSMISIALIEFTGQVINSFEFYGYRVDKIVIPPNLIHQINVYINGFDFSIKMTLDNDPIKQADGVSRVLKYLKNNKNTVQYLDARVPGRVFYK